MIDSNVTDPQANQILVWSEISNAFINVDPNATQLNIDIPTYTVSPLSNDGFSIVNGFVGNTLQTRTIVPGQGINLIQSGGEIEISVTSLDAVSLNGLSDTAFLKVGNQLSEIDVAPLRQRLDVYTKNEIDSEFMGQNASNIPDMDNVYDLGSNGRRYADVYAKTFHGTATYALVSGSIINKGAMDGDVLVWRQADNDWVPEDVLNDYIKKEGLQILPPYGERVHVPETLTFDVSISNVFMYEFDNLETGTVSLVSPNDGNLYSITVILRNGENSDFNWPSSNLVWIGTGQAPNLTTHDILTFFTTDGSTWYGTYAGSLA